MNLEDLKTKHPDIYAAALSEGEAQGVQAERARIKEINDMALPGMETLTNKAMFESGISAGEFAVELIKAQKKTGETFLNDVKADAAEAGDVPASGATQNDTGEDEEALLAHLKAQAENKNGRV